jgi:ABC-type Fe3+-citrate transport system substrate-binding protein
MKKLIIVLLLLLLVLNALSCSNTDTDIGSPHHHINNFHWNFRF